MATSFHGLKFLVVEVVHRENDSSLSALLSFEQ